MKTYRTAPELPLSYKAINFYKTLNVYKALNIYKAPNICKILLPLNNYNRMYRVSKAREDKAYRPVLDTEEITILLSINAKN